MGFTRPDPELLDAWALASRAERHVRLRLDTLQDDVQGTAVEFGQKAKGPERLRVGLHGRNPPLCVLVALRPPGGDDPEAEKVRHAIQELGHEKRRGSQFHYRYRERTDAEQGSRELPEVVLGWVRDQVDALTRAGLPSTRAKEDEGTKARP